MNDSKGTATKAEKPRLMKVEEMPEADRKAFDALSEAKQAEYRGRLAMQDAKDMIDSAKATQTADREAKQAANKKEKSIKEIIAEVRAGTLEATLEAVSPKFAAMEPPLPTEEYESTLERIKTDSVRRSPATNLPVKPAYELTRELLYVRKEDLIAPVPTTLPDATQANSVRRYGMILPIAVRRSPDVPNKYIILDGKRRYHLLDPEAETHEVLLVSGFPDEDTAERAEVTVNRVRSLNVLSVANTLNRMRTRGIQDTEIRRDMGFKTGEIDKLTSVITNLIPELGAALTAGNITPSVALSIAKLPKPLQGELATVYADRVKANPGLARVSESDVEKVRQKRAADSAKRDAPTLAGLAGSVSGEDAKTPAVDKTGEGAVDSKTPPKTGNKK